MTDEEMDEYVDLYHHIFAIPLDEWIENGIEWEKHMRRIKAAREKDRENGSLGGHDHQGG